MKILITGANGLLATHTIKHLLQEGYNVKSLIRNKSKFLLPDHPRLDLVQGDILDKASVENAVEDCNYVVHIAALTAQDIATYQPYYEVNVKGTKNILDASLKHKVKKLFFVSTANTRGFGSKKNPGHEGRSIRRPFVHSYYAKSKLEAEEMLLAASGKIEVILLNPTFMIGAYDAKPSSGRIILMGHQKIVFYPPGGKNFVNAGNAAEAIAAAIKKGKNREAYLLAGENLSYKQFFKKVQNKNKRKSLIIKIPKFLLISAGYGGNILRMVGIKTDISSTNMKILCVRNYYSNQKVTKELEVEFQPIDLGINEAIKWFKENGKISS